MNHDRSTHGNRHTTATAGRSARPRGSGARWPRVVTVEDESSEPAELVVQWPFGTCSSVGQTSATTKVRSASATGSGNAAGSTSRWRVRDATDGDYDGRRSGRPSPESVERVPLGPRHRVIDAQLVRAEGVEEAVVVHLAVYGEPADGNGIVLERNRASLPSTPRTFNCRAPRAARMTASVVEGRASRLFGRRALSPSSTGVNATEPDRLRHSGEAVKATAQSCPVAFEFGCDIEDDNTLGALAVKPGVEGGRGRPRLAGVGGTSDERRPRERELETGHARSSSRRNFPPRPAIARPSAIANASTVPKWADAPAELFDNEVRGQPARNSDERQPADVGEQRVRLRNRSRVQAIEDKGDGERRADRAEREHEDELAEDVPADERARCRQQRNGGEQAAVTGSSTVVPQPSLSATTNGGTIVFPPSVETAAPPRPSRNSQRALSPTSGPRASAAPR